MMNSGANATFGAICRREHLLEEHRHAEEIAQAGPQHASDHEPCDGNGDGGKKMHEQILAREHARELMREIGDGRNDVGRNAEGRRHKLPGEEEDHSKPDAAQEDGCARRSTRRGVHLLRSDRFRGRGEALSLPGTRGPQRGQIRAAHAALSCR
jgi:hypothetical protein